MNDEFFMREALKEAQRAYKQEEVPVGAVITWDGKIIAKAHNQVRKLKDPTAHAEMIAITQAADYLGYERLNSCKMYVTIEPCIMCAGAIVLARLDEVIYGASDNKLGAFGSVVDIRKIIPTTLKVKLGILQHDCKNLIQEFFRQKRIFDFRS